MIHSNDNWNAAYVVTIESDQREEGAFSGFYLVAVQLSGSEVPIDAEMCASAQEALVAAERLRHAHQPAVIHDLTGEVA